MRKQSSGISVSLDLIPAEAENPSGRRSRAGAAWRGLGKASRRVGGSNEGRTRSPEQKRLPVFDACFFGLSERYFLRNQARISVPHSTFPFTSAGPSSGS